MTEPHLINAAPKPKRLCAVAARVTRSTMVCREHVSLEFAVNNFPPSSPGQFLELLCTPTEIDEHPPLAWHDDQPLRLASADWITRQAFVRRPFSIADRVEVAGESRLTVISRAIGPGTRFLETLRVGDSLDITGPLGRPFDISDVARPLLLVGGGVGIPPLLYLSRELHNRGAANVCVIFGAMSADLVPVLMSTPPRADGRRNRCFDLPAHAPFDGILTTDDGSAGLRGRVTDGMRLWAAAYAGTAARPLVLACGPEPMLRAVGVLTRELEWDCQLCIERNMGCGLGTCLSCVVRVVDSDRPEGWRWALSCSEGPVFERDRLYKYCEA